MERLRFKDDNGNEFPEWEANKVGSLGDIIRGVSYKGNSDLYKSDNENSVRLLRSNNIFEGRINLDEIQFVNKKEKTHHHGGVS